jgi:hypothetical protein
MGFMERLPNRKVTSELKTSMSYNRNRVQLEHAYYF